MVACSGFRDGWQGTVLAPSQKPPVTALGRGPAPPGECIRLSPRR